MSADVQVDNTEARVTRWTLAQGEETGHHRHEYDYIVVPLVTARMQVRKADGSESTTELSPGASYYKDAGPEHNVRNDEAAVVDFIEVEIVRPRPAGGPRTES